MRGDGRHAASGTPGPACRARRFSASMASRAAVRSARCWACSAGVQAVGRCPPKLPVGMSSVRVFARWFMGPPGVGAGCGGFRVRGFRRGVAPGFALLLMVSYSIASRNGV
uniref:NifS like protein n=1 Tax=Streptomyces sp. W75 TaxID=1170711 RepID=I0CED8_9ACTN|nr:NifS like protein [Streptomyces sp. W75]